MLATFWDIITTTPLGVILCLLGLLLCIIALFGHIKTPWVELILSVWQRIAALLLGLGLIVLAVFPLLPSKPELPIGTVIIWWGNLKDKPPGYELCDGKPPESKTATLKGNKPDLVTRFPRGTADKVSDVRTDRPSAGLGGTDDTAAYQSKTAGTTLSVPQLPPHNHGGTTGNAGSHAHDTYLTDRHSGGAWGKGSRQEPAPETSSIFSNTVFRTSTDGAHTHTIATEGEGKPHDHDFSVPAHDNRPAFQEVFFLIRVE